MGVPAAVPQRATAVGMHSALEAVLQRFEAAWHEGSPPAIDDYRTGDAATASLLLLELVQLDLEFRLRRGEPVRVETYLTRYPELAVDGQVLRELIVAEYRLRRRSEPGLSSAEYRERFPQCGPELADDLTHLAESSLYGVRASVAPAAADAAVVAPPGFALVRVLGEGGMGVVYRARDLTLQRDVALKFLKQDYPPGSAVAVRFLEEARITGQLQHPGIPAVYQAGMLADGRPYLALKLIKGRTLAELLERGTPNVLAIFEAICQAVGYAHAHGVIHRDLKPQTSMVGSFGEVQVMDWGLAKVLGSTSAPRPQRSAEESIGTQICSLRDTDGSFTQVGSILGTPAYMAPEQAGGETERIDARTDVFALGAILCTLLTGKPPYTGKDAETVRLAAIRGKLDDALGRLDACGAEPELVALAKRCLAFEPAQRPADARAVAAEIAALRAAAEERARQAELERARSEVQAAEQRKRRRVQRLLAAVVALMVLAGGAAGWWEHARVVRNAEALAAQLDACTAALAADDAVRAEAALAEAERRAPEGGGAELLERLEHCKRDMDTLRALDAVDAFRWTLHGSKFPPGEEQARRLRAMFAGMELLPPTPPETAAERVQASAVKDRLLAALDLWLLQAAAPEARAVLQAADPDPYRDRVRDALRAIDGPRIAELAQQAEALAQPPRYATVLGQCRAVPLKRRHEVLEAALRARPNSLTLLMALGNSFPGNQRPGAANRARWYQSAVAVQPTNAAVHNALGNALMDLRDRVGARAEYETAIRLAPAYAYPYNGLANVLGDLKDDAGALAAYQKALALEPTDAIPYNGLGNLRRRMGDLDGAAAAFREAIRLDPRYAVPHNGLGLLLKDQHDIAGAVAEFRASMRLDPRYAQPHNNLGDLLRDQNDLAGAMAEFQAAIRLDPTYAAPHLGLAGILDRQNNRVAAAAQYRIAIRLDPTDGAPHNNLGNILHGQGDLGGAAAEYREAIRLDPADYAPHNGLGNLLRDQGDRAGAIAEYRAAIRLNPKHAHAHNNLGIALRAQGDCAGAVAEYREAIRLDPKYAPPHNNLGNLLGDQHDLIGAIAEYREAIRLDPAYAAPHHGLGGILHDQHQLAEAVQELREAIRLNPKQAESHHMLGMVLLDQNRPAEALPAFKEAIRLKPTFDQSYNGAAVALNALGKSSAALAFLREAAQKHPDWMRHADTQLRYNCACSAVLAGTGQAKDAPPRDQWPALRKEALAWLQADLPFWQKRLANASGHANVHHWMTHWLSDSDLAAVRDPAALQRLPEDERRAWATFWSEVRRLRDASTPPKR